MSQGRPLGVRWLREAAGLTQAEVADRSGVSVRTIRALENGQIRSPHRYTLEAVLDAVDATPRQRAAVEQGWSAQRARSLSDQLRSGVDLDGLVRASGMVKEPDYHVLSCSSRTEIGANRRPVGTTRRYAVEFIESGPGAHYSLFSGDQSSDVRLMTFGRATGCTLIDRIDLPGQNASLVVLDLGAPVAKGETRLFSYEILEQEPPTDPDLLPITESLGDSDGMTQGDRRPVAHLAMEVVFHPDQTPAVVERISRDNASAEPEIHEAVELDAFHAVHLVIQNARPGGHGFRWSW